MKARLFIGGQEWCVMEISSAVTIKVPIAKSSREYFNLIFRYEGEKSYDGAKIFRLRGTEDNVEIEI